MRLRISSMGWRTWRDLRSDRLPGGSLVDMVPWHPSNYGRRLDLDLWLGPWCFTVSLRHPAGRRRTS